MLSIAVESSGEESAVGRGGRGGGTGLRVRARAEKIKSFSTIFDGARTLGWPLHSCLCRKKKQSHDAKYFMGERSVHRRSFRKEAK